MCDLTTLRSASATSAAGAKAIQLMSTAYGHSPSVAGSLVGYRCLLKMPWPHRSRKMLENI